MLDAVMGTRMLRYQPLPNPVATACGHVKLVKTIVNAIPVALM